LVHSIIFRLGFGREAQHGGIAEEGHGVGKGTGLDAFGGNWGG